MYCKNSDKFKKDSVPNTQKAKIAILSPSEDKDFIVRKIKIESGGSMPNHTNEIQHQQYVLEGEARVVVGNTSYHAKKGDFIYIPAGINHYYEACYDCDYEFLCMITTQKDNIKML